MSQSRQHDEQGMSPGEAMNWLYGLASIHAMCILPFIRSRFGTQAIGVNALFGLVVMVVVAVQCRDPVIFNYIGLWLLVVLIRQGEARSRKRKGLIQHSQYAGYPWVTAWIPLVRNEQAARGLDPLVCLAIGTAMMPISENLAKFICFGFVSILVKEGIEQAIVNRRVERMRDAQIEGNYYGSQINGWKGH
jgi:hypothetical protein